MRFVSLFFFSFLDRDLIFCVLDRTFNVLVRAKNTLFVAVVQRITSPFVYHLIIYAIGMFVLS